MSTRARERERETETEIGEKKTFSTNWRIIVQTLSYTWREFLICTLLPGFCKANLEQWQWWAGQFLGEHRQSHWCSSSLWLLPSESESALPAHNVERPWWYDLDHCEYGCVMHACVHVWMYVCRRGRGWMSVLCTYTSWSLLLNPVGPLSSQCPSCCTVISLLQRQATTTHSLAPDGGACLLTWSPILRNQQGQYQRYTTQILHYHGDEPKQVGQSVSQHTDHPCSFKQQDSFLQCSACVGLAQDCPYCIANIPAMGG